jgi:hypothetical protein
MATNATWTVVFEDKVVIKQSGDAAGTAYTISDDSFWNQEVFSNLWAIQYGTSNTSDEVEYRDSTPHSSYAAANIGDINQFSNRWDLTHLTKLQADWDADVITTYNEDGTVASTESESDQIARKGERPTSYSS